MFLSLAPLCLLLPCASPQDPSQDQAPLTDERREELVDSLAQLMIENYVFEEVGQQLGRHLREQLYVQGAYDDLQVEALCRALTRDLRSVNDDLHLRVAPRRALDPSVIEEDPAELQRQRDQADRRRNFGFERVERLEGNIGYLDLSGFSDTNSDSGAAGNTAVAAMGFLAHVDALIIDLRRNGGGSPSMIQLLSSYFFEEPVHLNSFFWRGREGLEQRWTMPHVPGKKLVDVPLFVLTSARTFSAAEEFTYNLKNLKRATIIGETTGGGAHPGSTHPVADILSVFIPQGRAISPITGTNWEGVGVKPHLSTPQAKALEKALEAARKATGPKAPQLGE